MANGFRLRPRFPIVFGRRVGDQSLGLRVRDRFGGHRRARVHLPPARANDTRQPEQGVEGVHAGPRDAIPEFEQKYGAGTPGC